MFFKDQTSEAIMDAVNRFESLGQTPFDYKECRKWAEQFSEERFKNEIRSFVEEKYLEFMDR